MGRISEPTVTAAGNFAMRIPSILIAVIVTFISAYFFIAERDEVIVWVKKITPDPIARRMGMVMDNLKYAVGGYFKAQLKIMAVVFVILFIGFLVLDVHFGFLFAFLIAFLDFLPFFGTGAVMLPWAIIKILSADYEMAIWLLVIWGVGQLVRQIIQPKIVGDSVGIAPLPTLILLFIGYKYAGVAGMILAIPTGIIVINMNRAGIFDTLKTSLCILAVGLNRFRRFDEEDKEIFQERKP